MLRRLTLENFKNWRELDIELGPITLLFGTNSAGKTSILKALLMLKQTVNSLDREQHINFGSGPRDYVDLGSYQDLVYGHNSELPIALGLHWHIPYAEYRDGGFFIDRKKSENDVAGKEEEQGTITYDISWRLQNDDIVVESLAYSAMQNLTRDHLIRLKRLESSKYNMFEVSGSRSAEVNKDETTQAPESCYLFPRISVLQPDEDATDFWPLHLSFSFEFQRTIDKLRYLGPLRQYPSRYYQWTGEKKAQVVEPDGADTIATLISSERDDKSLRSAVAHWLEELDLVDALNVTATDRNKRFYEVTVKTDGVESALIDVGFGVSQVLPVVALLLSAPTGSIVLLEQPELHLHPNAQSQLADLLLEVAEKRDLQLIIESHSEHILRRLQRRIAEPNAEFAQPENIKLYFCEPRAGGSVISAVETDRFGTISNWPKNFFGDISGDLHSMIKAGLERRREELGSA